MNKADYLHYAQSEHLGRYSEDDRYLGLARSAVGEMSEGALSSQDFHAALLALYEASDDFIESTNEPSQWDKPKRWHNKYRQLHLMKKTGGIYYFNEEMFGGAIFRYMMGALRSPSLDRGMVDCLIAQETSAFIDRAAGFYHYLAAQFTFLVAVGFFVAGVSMFTSSDTADQPFGWEAALYLLGAYFGFQFLLWVWPWGGPFWLYREMKYCYHALTGTVVPVAELSRRVRRATERGVVWPPELYALLDDIEQRRRFL